MAVWQGVREHRGWIWIGAGVVALGLYGFVATLQPDANASIMGTGIVANAAVTLPMQFTGLRATDVPANERTFLAWLRTSLALVAGGVAVVQLVPEFGFPAPGTSSGSPSRHFAVAVAAGSLRRWHRVQCAMPREEDLPPTGCQCCSGWRWSFLLPWSGRCCSSPAP